MREDRRKAERGSTLTTGPILTSYNASKIASPSLECYLASLQAQILNKEYRKRKLRKENTENRLGFHNDRMKMTL